MHTHSFFKHTPASYQFRICSLIFAWGIGLLVGMVLAIRNFAISVDSFFTAFITQPSLAQLLLAIGLPIVFVCLTLQFSVFYLSCLPVFITALCRGFCGMAIVLALGNRAWLIRLLFLFSSSCGSTLIWWLLLRHCQSRRTSFIKDVCAAGVLVCGIIAVELIVISPFLSQLTKYF